MLGNEDATVENVKNETRRYEKAPSQENEQIYEGMWSTLDGFLQSDDAPVGTRQSCYWTDGITIIREKKADGKWAYVAKDEWPRDITVRGVGKA